MFEALYGNLDYLLGLSQSKIGYMHMILRGLFVYCSGVLIILVNRRFVGERTPIDMMLKIIIGSILANAITGDTPFFPTLAVSLFLVFLNWALSFAAFWSHTIEKFVKGSPIVLYKNKKLQWPAMQNLHVTKDDVMSELRKNAGLTQLDQAQEIIFENTGDISVIPQAKEPIQKITHRSNDDGE